MDEILKAVPALTVAIISIACIGGTELITRLYRGDVEAATKIFGCAVIGVVLGVTTGTPWYLGLVLGLAGSGLVTSLDRINAVKPAPEPQEQASKNKTTKG